ncbi:MAG: hypothetical protein PHS46_08090 [Candidatus Omnitrophica bacterium]|nr:hypothetical protein [Candidatus Omnitrophota bacterium]
MSNKDALRTYPEMNKNIVGILRINSDNPTGLYAANRIEELESRVKELEEKIRNEPSWGCCPQDVKCHDEGCKSCRLRYYGLEDKQ